MFQIGKLKTTTMLISSRNTEVYLNNVRVAKIIIWKIFPEVINLCYGQQEIIFTDSDLDCVIRNIKAVRFTKTIVFFAFRL